MSALSDRGAELSAAGGRVETFKAILNDLYDPDTNPGGYVNIGIAENVCFALIVLMKESGRTGDNSNQC